MLEPPFRLAKITGAYCITRGNVVKRDEVSAMPASGNTLARFAIGRMQQEPKVTAGGMSPLARRRSAR